MTANVKRDGGVATLTFASGKDGNPVSRAMLTDIRRALSDLADAPVVVIAGDDKDFTIGRDRSEPKVDDPFQNFALVTAVNEALAALPGIVIAAVRGRAHGFGVGLVLRADLAVAAASTHFWLDEVKLGIPPMFIMERMLRHLPPKQALDIVLTSREFSAAEALSMGLVSRVVEDDVFDGEIGALAAELGGRAPDVLMAVKQYLRSVDTMPSDASNAYALLEQTRFALQKK
jgi:enoyl-CoA hydratase/carnithine racemase